MTSFWNRMIGGYHYTYEICDVHMPDEMTGTVTMKKERGWRLRIVGEMDNFKLSDFDNMRLDEADIVFD